MTDPTDPTPEPDGDELANEGIDRANRGANPAWTEAVDRIFRVLAEHFPLFTTDEVWKILRAEGVDTPTPSAMGGAVRRAKLNGLIEDDDGRHLKTKRPEAHSRPIPLYRSLVYVEEAG
jgi:hypothetical protein